MSQECGEIRITNRWQGWRHVAHSATFAAALASLGVACGDNALSAQEPDAGAEAEGQGGLPSAELAVNEVAARGVGEDWLEIVNRSAEPVDLCHYFVTDALDRLDHYYHLAASPPPQVCNSDYLNPGERLVVFADDRGGLGPGHAPFKLGVADEVHILSTSGELVDSVYYFHPEWAKDFSLARYPDGEGLFWFSAPSPGLANDLPDEGPF